MPAEFDSGAFVRQSAWHKMGTVLPEFVTTEEMIEASGLDWEVELRPVFTTGLTDSGSLSAVAVPEHMAVVRTDRNHPLGVVGVRYTAIQNHVMFSFIEALLDSGDVQLETAGSLKGGKWVWLQARLGDEYSIAGDTHQKYLTIGSSHDGSLAFSVYPTNIRVVCANTFSAAYQSRTLSYRVKHTARHNLMVAEARKALDLSFRDSDQFAEDVERLMNEVILGSEVATHLERMLPVTEATKPREVATRTRAKHDILALYHGPTVGTYTGSKWGFVNAVNEYEQWGMPIRSKKGTSAAERSLTRYLRGNTGILTNKAMALVGATAQRLHR